MLNKRVLLLLSLILSLPALMYATIYQGRVVDAKGQPVSYVNVVQKMNPTLGVSTDSLGHFSIDISKTGPADLLYFSFIGYKTVKTPISALSPNRSIKVILEEDPFELFEVVVTNIPETRKEKRKFIGDLLVKIDKQLERDYAQKFSHVVVASNLGLTNYGVDMTHEHVVADIQEWPFLKDTLGEDSIIIALLSAKHYTNPKFETMDLGLNMQGNQVSAKVSATTPKDSVPTPQQVAEAKLKMEKELKALDLQLQALLWKMDAQKLFETCEKNLNNWTLEGMDEGNYALHYKEKKSMYLGILRLEMDMIFFVDPIDYHVMRISNKTQIKATVPLWGYKLDKEFVQIINTFDLTGGEDVKKFRLKRVKIDIYGTLNNKVVDDVLTLEEKQTQIDLHVLSTKEDDIQFTADIKSTVMKTIK